MMPKMQNAQKMKMTQKMEKKNKVNPKIEDSRNVKTYLYHATFPLDYHSINDLRLVMMFIVETGNRNPHVKKHDLRQRAEIKDDIRNAKTTNITLFFRSKIFWKQIFLELISFLDQISFMMHGSI